MNNLKEKIEKAINKYDVVVLSGSPGVGKSTLLKEIEKERHIHYSGITYNSIKFSIKHSDLIAIDDVRETELKNVIQRIQDAVAKTNIKTKAIIVVDKFDKSVLDSVVLKIKHFHMAKPRSRSVMPRIKEVQELLQSIEEQKFITDKIQVSCLNDLYQMEQQLKYSMDLNKKYENEAVLHDHNYTQLSLDLDDSKAENEVLIKENYSLHLKIKELNDLLYDQNEEKTALEETIDSLKQSVSYCMNKIQTYQNTVAVFEDKTRLLEKANNELESYLNEKVHCLKEELNNEVEETAFFKEMSEDFITQIKWLNNTIEVYRGEVDEDTIRRVEYTVQQLRESFGDDYEV
ncbi:AAA family ATPase [Enterobacter hormaechei]|uniref:AAA family ATPase n=1 Tax=Enterobacter hormaechei TaxID=158836 RepID=UPI000EFC046A|nr:AAA family ATPase [Enterobacter hormaechei]HCR1842204.1 AAA family ATPase [Enterobacter kobei]HCR1916281.1 AAA family ATPase [Enterobacter kobei]HCR1921077.1 AAA family ATPase [Enterobacter kobei]HCR1925389.1 AAA family ATPase [Enterobacter kobei]